ncbi:Hypothetical_protein [Hexamita inflata]|uniref:Hypothetical_protein n=1 Tax=Hexamita inflata TaxID=28002 RepID=A0ABP1GU94_9EUKA
MLTVRQNRVEPEVNQYENRFINKITSSDAVVPSQKKYLDQIEMAQILYTEESRKLRGYVQDALGRTFVKVERKQNNLQITDMLTRKDIEKRSEKYRFLELLSIEQLRYYQTRRQYQRIPQPKFKDVSDNVRTDSQEEQKQKYFKDQNINSQLQIKRSLQNKQAASALNYVQKETKFKSKNMIQNVKKLPDLNMKSPKHDTLFEQGILSLSNKSWNK